MKGQMDWTEVLIAALAGVARQIRHRSRGDQHKRNSDVVGGWERDIESACAEKFAAKMLGFYWHDGLNGATDIGPHQVRHTAHLDGRLMLYPEDKDDEVFFLVVGRAPFFEIVGWNFGREGKRTEYWEDPTGKNRWAFFPPRKILHRLDELGAPVEKQEELAL
jgi:hypothetical protein